jgi:RNA polymerase sigma-54 factor
MAMKMKMGLKLSQQLRMTPQLQQAIKLLQLSRLELENMVQQEMQENPILEEVHEVLDEESFEAKEKLQDGDKKESADMQDPQKQDEFEWENYVEDSPMPGQMTNFAGGANEEINNYENVFSSPQTLYDHLMWQLSLSGFNEEEKELGAILIGYIEDDGYLKTPIAQIAEDEEVDATELEEMIPFLQEFDPPGVFARDLKECLLIQAKILEEDTHELVAMIENHLGNLEKKNYPAIAKDMGIDLEVVVELSKIIYSMEPKPGRSFITNETHYVTPDVYVYPVGDEYVVSLNEDGLPRLKVSNFYKNVLKGGEANDVTQDYIQDKLRSAVWLIKSIHQRQRTIYKVAESIVKHQRDFFDKGPKFIKPMILRDIANDIEMHESTVSRVTTNKYMHTPQGIFELKHFFNSGISKTDGDSLASESVKVKIKELVDQEDSKSPLSDQKIVELLKKDGIKIARRTVAKYRDALGILPSSKRKKYF